MKRTPGVNEYPAQPPVRAQPLRHPPGRRALRCIPAPTRIEPCSRPRATGGYLQAAVLLDPKGGHARAHRGPEDGGRLAPALWIEFCIVTSVSIDSFGKPVGDHQHSLANLARTEQEVLSAFAAYMVTQLHRRRAGMSSTVYVEHCVSSIRSHYAALNGRRPGTFPPGTGESQYHRVLRGLKRLQPAWHTLKHPILQQLLRAIRSILDIK